MTEDEKKAAELTAEVFAETFMRMVKERLQIVVSGNNLQSGTIGQGGTTSVWFNIQLMDKKAPEGTLMTFASTQVQITLKKDNWGNPYLAWGP